MYDFRTLSPLDFEELVRDLLQAELGLRFESFGPGRDLGIDFRFATSAGTAIVQAKHYPDIKTDSLVSAAAKENAKVAKLKPQRYIFVTSAPLTPPAKAKIKAALPDAPLTDDDIIGQGDLNNMLGRHPEIEKQHFKLWLASTAVLERILHSGVYNRTQAEMDEIKAMVPKFVQNKSVPEAEAILEKHGALIIAGEPGIGKSTLARMLVWLHAEQDWRISVIDDISEAFEIADGNEKRLVFFDDFLGQVGLTRDLIRGIDQRFPPFFRRVKANPKLRFILTTRDYILRQAQAQSWRLDTAEVNAASFVLNVSQYTRAARAQILFNHIWFSNLNESERASLLEDDFFLKIIDHRNFNPRLIDLLTTADYISMAERPIRDTVLAVLENPEELWEKPYRSHIGDEGRALMLATFFNTPRVPLADLERSFGRVIKALDLSIPEAGVTAKFRAALRELEGSVLAIQDRMVSFSNPGIRDYLQKAIREDKLLMPILGFIKEFDELDRAWEYYKAQKAEPTEYTASIWAAAAQRMIDIGMGTALEKLSLSMSIFDEFAGEALLEVVKNAASNLSNTGIESSESGLCKEILEQFIFSSLPYDVHAEIKAATSHAIAQMIASDGYILELDELESLGEELVKWGDDEGAATDAVRTALEEHADSLTDHLSHIQSIDELEDFEKQFYRLAETYGAKTLGSAYTFESRKEDILEQSARHDNDEGYGRRSASPVAEARFSDDQIRSMFSGLKS